MATAKVGRYVVIGFENQKLKPTLQLGDAKNSRQVAAELVEHSIICKRGPRHRCRLESSSLSLSHLLATMADPISLLTSIAGAIGACAKISKALIDLGMQFAATKAAASSLAAECFTMRAVLERLSSLMKSRPELLAPRGGGKADLGPCFQGIVQSIDQGICDLDRQISSLSRTGKPGDMNTGHRILFMFKEGSIKSTVDDIRQQRATLSMLLSCIQRCVNTW